MPRNILILDLNPFFGGGQKFLLMIQKYLSCTNTFFFIVKDKSTFDQLIGTKKYFIEENNLFSQIKVVNTFIKENDIEVVIFNGNRPIYFTPFITVKKKIAYKHTSNNAFASYRRHVGHIILNFCYLFCDRIVLLYTDAIKEVFLNKDKVYIINNGVEPPRLLNKKDLSPQINILCVSRLDENKGIKWLINVFHETFGNNNSVQLTIAGSGYLYEHLNSFIIDKGIDNIKLLGFVEDIPFQLSQADIFILPSKFESFPFSILEAMSYGLPIIATDTGGVRDMVTHDKNGYLVDYLNDKELRESLLRLYENQKIRLSYGNCSAIVFNEQFLISKCVKKIENLINEI
jgi:glycosyltransferase involved in cell wall biosynthesis